jgi:hypothetical protein
MLAVRSRLVALRTVAAALMAPIVLGFSATMATADESVSEPSLGSASDYVKNTPDFASAYGIPLLGIDVNNGADSLKDEHAYGGLSRS